MGSDTVPYYKKRGHVASSYLCQNRRELLTLLPVHHPMRERTGASGILHQRKLPVIPRPPFTDAEIRDIKRHRNEVASDPDNASSHLQRSQLISMWNADYDQQEQWHEYDQAQPIMEERREYSGLPDEAFESHDIVGVKRKRVVSAGYEKPSRARLLADDDDMITEANDLEDGEVDENIMQSVEEMNQHLQQQNAALRQIIDHRVNTSPSGAPPSPPESDASEQSSDEKEAMDQRLTALHDVTVVTPQGNTAPNGTFSMECSELSLDGPSSPGGAHSDLRFVAPGTHAHLE